jgi:hypothetical protein
MFLSEKINVTDQETPLVALLLHMLLKENEPAMKLASKCDAYDNIRTIAERFQREPPVQPGTRSEARRERSISVATVGTVRTLQCLG